MKGYIQGLGGVPFWTLFYQQEQLECFRDICRSGSVVLHFDSTGSVIKRLPEHNQPFYYTLPAAQDSMPVCEFLTTCHRHAWIMTIVDQFLNDVATLNSGRRTMPRTVIVDFSFAMIYAVLLAFNRSTPDAFILRCRGQLPRTNVP